MATKLKDTGVEFPDGTTQTSAGLPQPPIETTLEDLDTADYGLITEGVTATASYGSITSGVTASEDYARLGREAALSAGTFRIDPNTYALVIHDGTTYGGNPAMAGTMNNHVFNGRLRNSQGLYFAQLESNQSLLAQDWSPIRMTNQINDDNMGAHVDGGFESSFIGAYYEVMANFRGTGNDFKIAVGISGTPDATQFTTVNNGESGQLHRTIYVPFGEVVHLMAYGINVAASQSCYADECRIFIRCLGN